MEIIVESTMMILKERCAGGARITSATRETPPSATRHANEGIAASPFAAGLWTIVFSGHDGPSYVEAFAPYHP